MFQRGHGGDTPPDGIEELRCQRLKLVALNALTEGNKRRAQAAVIRLTDIACHQPDGNAHTCRNVVRQMAQECFGLLGLLRRDGIDRPVAGKAQDRAGLQPLPVL